MPDDLRLAYEHFMVLASQHGLAFAGMMAGTNPPALYVIGNVNERGHDLAKLLREYARIIDEKTIAGLIESPSTPSPNAN